MYITDLSLTSGLLNGAIFFAQIVPSALTLDGFGLIPYSEIYNKSYLVQCVYKVVYGVWNLEFYSPCFGSSCLYENNSVLDLLMLNYLTAIFPILLVVAFEFAFSCASWGPFNRIFLGSRRDNCYRFWNRILRNERGRKTRVSCILLSYVRIAVISTYILTPTNLVNEDGNTSTWVLFLNASCEFLGAEHKHYAIPVLALSLVFLISIPFLFTVLRYENPDNTRRTIDYFLREFQQEYCHNDCNLCAKEDFDVDLDLGESSERPLACCQEYSSDHIYSICSGTAAAFCSTTLTTSVRFNTATEMCSCKVMCCSGRSSCLTSWSHKDYRWFAGWYFIARLILLLLFASLFPMEQYVLSLIACVMLIVFPLAVRPYVNKFYNYLDSAMFMLLALMIVLNLYQLSRVQASNNPSVVVFWIHHLLVLLPAAWIYLVIVYQIWKLSKAAQPITWVRKLFKKHSSSLTQDRVLAKSLQEQPNVPLI